MALVARKAADATAEGVRSVTIGRIWELLSGVVHDSEKNLSSLIAKLESSRGDIGQEQLLALQTKTQSWGNIISLASTLLRAIGDLIRGTVQNIK
jgi:hypothetical protein